MRRICFFHVGSVVLLLGTAGCGATAPAQAVAQPQEEAELNTVENDVDVFPVAFRGRWASGASACRDPDGKGVVTISARRISEYELSSVLIKNALSFEQGPAGQAADTIDGLVAESGEGELRIAKRRLSLSAGRLYLGHEDTPAAQRWSYPLIRCR